PTSRVRPPGSGVINRARTANGGAAGRRADRSATGLTPPTIPGGVGRYDPEVNVVSTRSAEVTGFATSPPSEAMYVAEASQSAGSIVPVSGAPVAASAGRQAAIVAARIASCVARSLPRSGTAWI